MIDDSSYHYDFNFNLKIAFGNFLKGSSKCYFYGWMHNNYLVSVFETCMRPLSVGREGEAYRDPFILF